MKLYIRQKVFSLGDKFTVRDESGQVRYTVEGSLFSLGKKLRIYDRDGGEAALIRQELLALLPRYSVYTNGSQVAQIRREFTLLRPRFSVQGPNWDIRGNILEYNYTIYRDGRIIADISKGFMTWGDSYELNIQDSRDELLALAVVLTIDCIRASQTAAAAGHGTTE